MENADLSSPGPVTALIVRTVRPERVADFEGWIADVNQVVRQFEGYLGTDLIRPRDAAHPEYVIVVRFDGYEHLKAWMESPQRQEWIKKSEALTSGAMKIQQAEGFTPWFSLPELPTSPVAPAKYKMSLLTILAIYPSLLLLSTLIQKLFLGWPRPLLILITVSILVPLMTYFIMPWMTHLFRGWLYPQAASGK